MARPCKSANLLTDCSQTKAEIFERIETEQKLKGKNDNIKPPPYLNANQKKIFRKIVDELKESDVLGNLDVYILTTCSISIDRLQEIETMINNNSEWLTNTGLMSSRNKYTRDFFRCCNELCLSPQSRAKLANINLQKKQENPLLKLLNDNDD